jgi:hypothetical protein
MFRQPDLSRLARRSLWAGRAWTFEASWVDPTRIAFRGTLGGFQGWSWFDVFPLKGCFPVVGIDEPFSGSALYSFGSKRISLMDEHKQSSEEK